MNDDEGKVKAKRPVRLVMNNKTFSIFEDEDYQNNMHTFQLPEALLYRSIQWCCVEIKDTYKTFKLCGFESMCGPRNKNIWAEEWDKAYSLFSKQCKSGITLLDTQDLKYFYDSMKDKVGQMDLDLEEKKERILEEKMKEKNVRILGGKIAKMQDLGYRVLNKEMNIEMLLKKEEQQREALELKNLLAKIRAEKIKKECMDKKIRERELEDKKLLAERDAKAEMSTIKKDISLDIELKKKGRN